LHVAPVQDIGYLSEGDKRKFAGCVPVHTGYRSIPVTGPPIKIRKKGKNTGEVISPASCECGKGEGESTVTLSIQPTRKQITGGIFFS
jgi:hypothetical protein